jgi:toxoflavin biosynthesis protein ToxD
VSLCRGNPTLMDTFYHHRVRIHVVWHTDAYIERCEETKVKTAIPLYLIFLVTFTGACQANPLPEIVTIPAGPFVHGSDAAEKEYGYQMDEVAYGHSVTRDQGWYENEEPRQERQLPAFLIMKNLVTNGEYYKFIRDTGHLAPSVTALQWETYQLIHPYERTLKFQWQNGHPDPSRLDHPVVLVSYPDAVAFADWLTTKSGKKWRLPSALEWEKAARGSFGNWFPWGNEFNPEMLNSHDKGPFDTMPVGSFAMAASPFGMLDAAGQVFEWTATSGGSNRQVVKGGSWDDKGCGVCRPAAWHTRPASLKHILVGFRLVKDD